MGSWDVPLAGGSLAAALLRAADWFNDALLERLEADGWPPISRGHAQVFVNLDAEGTPPAELARRIGITRQSTQVLVRHLEEHDLVELVPHPTDGRSRLVRLSDEGTRLVHAAVHTLGDLEDELADRIGAEHVAALRAALARPWGEPPSRDPVG